MKDPTLNTHQKALAINLDSRIYGTFAEIGAGQEVVRWFFHVGRAAHTVAKSMSAYDMTVSDAIYGKSPRYVSKQRLLQMLDHEYQLNLERLSAQVGEKKLLFAFADTVSTRGFSESNHGHGWMGIRFQAQPGAEASQVIIHVELLDTEPIATQEALGIVGVNLVYAIFNLTKDLKVFLQSLLDGLSNRRVRIDMLETSGPAFKHVDNRLAAVALVRFGLSEVAMFSCEGKVLQPSEVLYQSPVLVERGSFRPLTLTHMDILEGALLEFKKEPALTKAPVVLMEITMNNLMQAGEVDPTDFLARADVMATAGQTVMISDYFEFYRLAAYLARFTAEPIALALGVKTLRDLLMSKYYVNLAGGILEGAGRLFRKNLTLYIYPSRLEDGSMMTLQDFSPDGSIKHLFEYLIETKALRPVTEYHPERLSIASADVLQLIKKKDPSWEKAVPPQVAQIIKERGLFEYVG